ncbi:MAG: hypothetical protein BAJALOKI1v1_510001 [Promethearchaeota archaeon]|nr:MAG: hypothetical protein BAJALOKI1v1_510001 [Candidatus Lokiarchaeota archaeon]
MSANMHSTDDREQKALKLLKETRILNIVRLANMLIDLFGLEEAFTKVGKRAGQEVEIYIPSLDGYLTFPLVAKKKNFECRAEKAKNPVATVVFNVKKEDVLKVMSNIIKSKANISGLAKLIPKFMTRKIKINGSLFAALTLVKILMIGKNDIYN